MTRPAFDPSKTYRFKADAFPFEAAAKVPATLDWDADVSNPPTFATPTDVSNAAAAIILHGDGSWLTGNTTEPPTVGDIADQVRIELATELGYVDGLNTRLSEAWANEVATQAKQDAAKVVIDAVKVEVDKVPRENETYIWTNTDTGAAATVEITGAGP
jgi:hypothetical protein